MYSDVTLDHFISPRNVGELDGSNGVGTEGIPGEGNFMVIAVRVANGAVAVARFQTYGCPGAVAAGSCLTEWVTGMGVAEAESVTPEQLNEKLGGLPLGKGHCVSLAVGALRKALAAAGTGAARGG